MHHSQLGWRNLFPEPDDLAAYSLRLACINLHHHFRLAALFRKCGSVRFRWFPDVEEWLSIVRYVPSGLNRVSGVDSQAVDTLLRRKEKNVNATNVISSDICHNLFFQSIDRREYTCHPLLCHYVIIYDWFSFSDSYRTEGIDREMWQEGQFPPFNLCFL